MLLWMPRPTLLVLSLVLLIAAAFWEVSRNGFVSYDDPDYLTMNPMVQKGITSEGLAWAFGSINGERTYFHPLTWVSHMLDVQWFGLNAGGGVEYFLNRTLTLRGEARYHSIEDARGEEPSSIAFTIGLKRYF